MRKNPIIALLLTVVMLFAVVAPVMARTPEEIMNDVNYLNNQINILESTGAPSNSEIYSLFVDFTSISTTGNVSMSVYENTIIPTNTRDFTVGPYQWDYAEQELVKYSLGNVANYYRAEPYNTDITCKTRQPNFQPRDTIPFYVYGQYKVQAVAELFNGIPNCFTIQYYPSGGGGSSSYSGSSSQPKETIKMPVAEKEKAEPSKTVAEVIQTVFSVNKNTYSVSGETKHMDAEPYVKNDRTYVPVRYLAYSLGVPKEGVSWNSDTQQVGISKGDTNISLTIGSATMSVNNMPITMDVAPEITNNRTFLPARWVAEALGAEVTWDDTTKDAIIRMPIGEPGN
jgi:hypothetical protein